MLALILFAVGEGSKEIFQDEGLNFLTNTDWNAVPGRESFGALPYIIGTLVCSGIAMAVGVPISLGIAIFLSEIAGSKIGRASCREIGWHGEMMEVLTEKA